MQDFSYLSYFKDTTLERVSLRRLSVLFFILYSSLFALCPLLYAFLGDDFVIAGELHGEGSSALSERPQLRGVTEHFRQ